MTQFPSTSNPPLPISVRSSFKRPHHVILATGIQREPRILPLLENPPAVASFGFDMASLASSMTSNSITERGLSFPNWTRLDAASSHEGSHHTRTIDKRDDITTIVIATHPKDASEAYRSGTLRSDVSISSRAPRIRVAFRYVISENAAAADDDDLILCWVGRDGIPRHFYRLTAKNATAKDGPIDASDHIERTFPGHAFVFCRRVDYYLDDGGGDGGSSERGSLRGSFSKTDHRKCLTSNRDGSVVVVVNDNGNTLFLRKKKVENPAKHGKSVDGDESGGRGMEWEAFLVVGGYRPGVQNPSLKGTAGMRRKESDDNDNDDDDEGEWMAQLVTIYGNSTKQSKDNPTNTSDQDDPDDPAPNLLDCYSCIQSIPLMRGMFHPKRHHPSAFVATESSADMATLTTDKIDVILNSYSLDVSVGMTEIDRTPIDTSDKKYDHVILGGWPCRLEPGCFGDDDVDNDNDNDNDNDTKTHSATNKTTTPSKNAAAAAANKLRQRFESDILSASRSLPPRARTQLQKTTPIWINKSQSFGPKAAPLRGRDACFHPGRSWLVRNGMNPDKCGGVEFYDARHYRSDCDLWGPGGLILHELCHAWHCLHTEGGYRNGDVRECYEKAMEEGLYECVAVHGPQGPKCKAYACTDPMEYFAELSVAFLGGVEEGKEYNKWFPFNRAQVKEHDPRAFEMLHRIWGVDPEGT